MNKTIALMLALVVVIAAAALATGSSGAAHRRYTIAFGADPKDSRVTGARAAAKQLGVRFVLSNCLAQGGCDQYDAKRLIARHVDAVVGAGYVPTLRPFFRKVRKAGILLISSGDDIAAKRDLWVNYSGTVAFAHALADALASQINGSGEYAILEEHGQYPIATTWAKDVAAYIPQAYPNMTLDGVLNLTGAGDQAEVDAVKSFMSAHPNLKGLIGIAPTEAYMAAEAITQAGRIGQVFSASNGGDYLGPELAGYIRSGAMEDVIGGDPAKLGYLTVWAVHRLLTGRHFRPGAYQVGGPIGTVHYYKHNKELRLGQPLTITKANVDVRRPVGGPEMNKRLPSIAIPLAAGAATAGLFAGPSTSSPGACSRPRACSISLTATGPSPSTLTAPATSYLRFDNTDAVPHTVVFANGLCSITLAPGQQGGPGVAANRVEHPDCNDNFPFYVGSYPYRVDGRFAGTVVTRPLRRAVNLTAPRHGIRHGTSLTLHGRVSWFDYNPFVPISQFRVIVLARHDGSHTFKPITTGRLWSSQPYASHGTISYSWKRRVHPGETTTYIAKVTGYHWFWSDATSRAFTVRVRH